MALQSTAAVPFPVAAPADGTVALPPAIAGAAFAISFTGMSLSGYTGTAGAVVFLAPWVLLGAAYGRATLHLLATGPRLVWLLPAFALLSTTWSHAPGYTLRFGLENAATAGCAVMSAMHLKPRTLLVALTVSLTATAIVSVALGRTTFDPLTEAIVFVGVFTSKNQVGFFSSLMLLAAVSLAIDGRQQLPARLLGVSAGFVSLPLLYLSRSATSVASVVVAMAALLLGLLLSRADRFGRARLLFVACVVLLFAAVPLVAAGSDAVDFLLAALGRNAKLTGRTDLWHYAVHIIADQPWLGYGFQAFWIPDQIDAEGLWSQYNIASRTGFHFHNSYIETAVELGYVGVAVLVATFLGILIGTIRWSWQDRSVAAAFFVAVTCCLVARSVTEVDALAQFQAGTFMLFVAGTYAATKPKDHPPRPRALRPN